ncbi:MAG: hypothetical protein ACSW77_05035 [Bacteroidales bacterium]|jgi:hypothetical protein
MSWKRFIIGEPMPDKNDPKYKERYEREVEAGRQFAQKSGISCLARNLQAWGQAHKIAFIIIVFGFVFMCLIVNVCRLVNVYKHGAPSKAVAVERVDSALHERLHLHE